MTEDTVGDEPDPIKTAGYVEGEHQAQVIAGEHTCDATCLALYGNAYVLVPLVPRWRRAWRSLRWPGARLGGLRLVHKDRIDQDQDD